MSTILTYLNDSLQTTNNSTFESQGSDELGHYLVLDNTIFYPQGGGQPSDQGIMTIHDHLIEIHHVRLIKNEVRHYTKQQHPFNRGHRVYSQINKEKRLTHTRLHTAGHLLSNIMEILYPEWIAVKGHHFPGEAYVEFKAKQSINHVDLTQLNKEINQLIQANLILESKFISGNKLIQYCPNLPYSIPAEKQIRLIRIGDNPFQPCGGTHVLHLDELKVVQLIKSKIKNDRLKISYELA